MRVRKLVLGLAGATAMLGATGVPANARLLSLTSQSFRMVFPRFDAVDGFASARCEVTVEGTFVSRTLIKARDTEIGAITRVRVGVCTTGSLRILTERLPWNMTYRVFTGTLPSIRSISAVIERFAFELRDVFLRTYLHESEANELAILDLFIGGGVITEARIEGRITKPATTNSIIEGLTTAAPTILNETRSISVRLI